MKIENIFSSFIIVDTVEVDNKSLLDFSYGVTKINQKSRKDNISQSNFLDLNLYPLKQLIDAVENKCNDIHLKIGLKSNFFQKITEAWVNIDHNINITSPHCHPGRVFSAVYYCQADETSSDLIFTNPNKSLCHNFHPTLVNNFNDFTSHNYRIKPKTGMLLIFPSSLEHYVIPTFSEKERISIAMNTQAYQKS